MHDGFLYVSSNTAVFRYPMTAGQLRPNGPAETIVEGFPEQRTHAAKPLAFDEAGGMYVTVGAPSNACQEADRRPGSPGLRPCPQREWQAGIWRFDAARAGQTQREDGRRFASGIRHAVAIAWNPFTQSLYAVQHGRDQLDTIAPSHFDATQNAELPSEELLLVGEGEDFGWPYCYHDPAQNRRVLAPEYGGDGTAGGDCAKYAEPLVAFPAHWAPNDLLFYRGTGFPARYREGAFIAFHGSWNRAPEPQGGYLVAFLPMAGGRPAGEWEVFADGFAGRDVPQDPRDAIFRPMGLAEGPDGSLYISDSQKGRIWRVHHPGTGSRTSP